MERDFLLGLVGSMGYFVYEMPSAKRTTYTMKRELYTMNENSTHKNDDFCKKNTKNTPQIEKC